MKKTKILDAIVRYNNGERPHNFRKPDWAHVIHDDTPYPAKAIWSLATGLPLSDFNTNVARDGFAALDFVTNDIGKYDEIAGLNLEKSKESSRAERLKRLATANELPKQTIRISKNYIRNADVIVEVLLRAGGQCESCLKPAPFKRAKDGTPFLEVHHKINLADGGKDTMENAEALCPNCHRKAHFG